MRAVAMGIGACAAWAPGRESWQGWCAWAGIEMREPAQTPTPPPVTLRRRVSPLGQQALKAAWGMPSLIDSCFVFASRHGEFDRTTALLRSVIAGEEASPADFSLSVHNALSGLLSIAARNRHGHTTIAAGRESFCYGLLEAAAKVTDTPDVPAILVFFDAPLSAPFDELFVEPADEPEALAVVLSIGPPGSGRWQVELSMSPAGESMRGSPALDFLAFLLPGTGSARSVGERHTWHWRHA